MPKTPPNDDRNLMAPLTYGGKVIHDRDAMVSLTDMWRAGGSDPGRKPAEWLRSADAERFVEFLTTTLNVGISHHDLVKTDRGGRTPGTWAHWQVGLAYAKYLSPEFHVWANTVVRNRMEEMRATPQIAPADIDVTDPAIIHRVMLHLREEADRGRKDATALRRIESSKGSFCITDAAKMLKMRGTDLRDWLIAHRWIYQRAGTDKWAVYADKQQSLLMESIPFRFYDRYGSERVKMHTVITSKGLVRLAHLLDRQLDSPAD